MKTGMFVAVLTAVMTMTSLRPESPDHDHSGSSGRPSLTPGWVINEPVAEERINGTRQDMLARELAHLLVANEHQLKAADIALGKAVRASILQFARSRQAQLRLRRERLLEASVLDGVQIALEGDSLRLQQRRYMDEQQRLQTLNGPAFELEFLRSVIDTASAARPSRHPMPGGGSTLADPVFTVSL